MKISVIIPTWNEARRITDVVEPLVGHDLVEEVIVADPGSLDGTADLAEGAGARIVRSAQGRGQQLCAGAAAAHGDVLLFLHADTLLPVGALAAVHSALDDPAVIGGNFRVLFDGDTDFANWLTGFYAWFRGKGLYYGDSVMFLRRTVYRDLGGFRPLALMEDYDLNRRMERHGGTVCIETPPVITSSRRFEGRRPVSIFCQWLLMHALFYARVPAALLSRTYDSARERTSS